MTTSSHHRSEAVESRTKQAEQQTRRGTAGQGHREALKSTPRVSISIAKATDQAASKPGKTVELLKQVNVIGRAKSRQQPEVITLNMGETKKVDGQGTAGMEVEHAHVPGARAATLLFLVASRAALLGMEVLEEAAADATYMFRVI